eukprot:CAMPEP_0197916574 /NCGR_PEP_ID=MMETSP1439-20131203/82214_1 /TAXON_ID=66791 /ORGANISM="Gonyaulax spinifera, Strain CCMP409" /LENGTH=748 /DNA_ID=CAMNT_0043538605 /DNA_START=90 /DNA_END=2336 /DNA_ORIENTATION=+
MSQTEELIDKRQRKEGICKAAWQLEDALKDTFVKEYPNDLSARELHFRAAQAAMEYRKALFLMVVLSIFEPPSWCDNSNFFVLMGSQDRCKIPQAPPDEVLLSNLPYLPPGWAVIIELNLLFLIARKLYLEKKLQDRHFTPLGMVYHSSSLITFGLSMVALNIADIAVFVAFRPGFRLAFIARTGYLVILPSVRQLFSCIYAVFFELTSIASFYVSTVLFFAWIAATVFRESDDMVNGKPANVGFQTFRSTVNTMFVSGSTEEFLYMFLPTYTAYRGSGLLWLTFLVVAKLLLLNLVLDTLVATYLKHSEDVEEESTQEKVKGILDSFKTLSEATGEGSEVTRDTFIEFVRELTKSPRIRNMDVDTVGIVFHAVDQDGSGLIDKREFCDICGVIEYDFWSTKRYSFIKDKLPVVWNSAPFQWFLRHYQSGNFNVFMNYVLLTNLGVIIWESIYDLEDIKETFFMENLELCFSLVYVMEVGLNLSVHAWGYYWAGRSNQFDFAVTWLLLASSMLDEAASSAAGADIKRYMNILRLLRLLRVLKQIKNLNGVQKMVQTISSLVAASQEILTLLGVVMYFFAALSVQLWGGILYASHPALHETEYKEKEMSVFNFNDISMAFGVWVVNLLCEYMPDIADAVNLTSGIPGSWLVLVIFYVFGVSIVFELVKAFTIEVFVNLHANWGKEQKEFATLASVEEEFEKRDLCLHYRIVGDTSAHEKIVKALEEMDEDLEGEEEEEGKAHEKSGNHH